MRDHDEPRFTIGRPPLLARRPDACARAPRRSRSLAHEVSDYACVYTSRASNLLAVSSERVFRTIDDVRPHDVDVFDEDA